MTARVTIVVGLYAFCASSVVGRADESSVDAELRRLDSYLHAHRGPASEAAFAAFESAIVVLRQDLAKTRGQLPNELDAFFETSVTRNVARVVDESDDYKVADYRCYMAAMRSLELSQQLIVLPIRAKNFDLARLDAAERQYEELLDHFESRAKAKPEDAPSSLVSLLLRNAGRDVFSSGFGVVLTEPQRKELEALLDAHADRWKSATSGRQQSEAMRAAWMAVGDFFVPLDRSSGGGLAARLADLSWSHQHRKLKQSVWEGVQASEKEEIAAIQVTARARSQAPEPMPVEPEPAPLP